MVPVIQAQVTMKMKLLIFHAFLVTFAVAGPLVPPELPNPPAGVKAEPCGPGDCDYAHLIMNELIKQPCRAITWIFARATTEDGNMVSHPKVAGVDTIKGASVGSAIARQFVAEYGKDNIAQQGVTYPADFAGNIASGGCSAKGVTETIHLFNLAHTKCPKTLIVAGGYRYNAKRFMLS